MATSKDWRNYANHNERMGWSDVTDQDRDWHGREQQRAEQQARSARELERERREDEERRNRR